MPIPILIWYAYNNSIIFTVLLLSYIIIYRGFVDGKRLIDKGIINKNELWKAFIPFWTTMYSKQLYFEK